MPTPQRQRRREAFGAIRPPAIRTVLRTGPVSQIALVTTFLTTLFLPVAVAVGVGIAVSLLLQLNAEALDLRVVELRRLPDGRLAESRVPIELAHRHITVLNVYGSLYYAGAPTLHARLPDPAGLDHPVVIIRLRGRTAVGSTSIDVLSDYAKRLEGARGRLYLTGVDGPLVEQFRHSGRLGPEAGVVVFPSAPILGASSEAAYRDGEAWLATQS
ncbi:MAG: STAS domain-containing protein [Candidatus Limnocylindrales bacterium]